MTFFRKSSRLILPALGVLVLLLITNAMVNRHQHFWRGMLVEHAHPYKNPFAGSQHHHSDKEILVLVLLCTNNLEDIGSYQPFVQIFTLEVGVLSLQKFDKGFIIPMFVQGLRAPPTYELTI